MTNSAIRMYNVSRSFRGEDVQCLVIPNLPLKPYYHLIFYQFVQVPLNSILAHFGIQFDNLPVDISKGLRYGYISVVDTMELKNCNVTIVFISILYHYSTNHSKLVVWIFHLSSMDMSRVPFYTLRMYQ